MSDLAAGHDDRVERTATYGGPLSAAVDTVSEQRRRAHDQELRDVLALLHAQAQQCSQGIQSFNERLLVDTGSTQSLRCSLQTCSSGVLNANACFVRGIGRCAL